MKVHLYTICWNEADMLGFFFRHYEPWVDRYVIYDDGSDDGSLKLMASNPKVEIRRFDRSVSNSFVLSHRELHNEVWKESRGEADWVIVTAIDEHLELSGGRDVSQYLDNCHEDGVTLIPAIGFQMISRHFPHPSWRLASTLTVGAPFSEMNKLSIFNPDRIVSTGFVEGRHTARPEGEIVFPTTDQMMLLHYKYLDFERTLSRHRALNARLGAIDVERSFGHQYSRDREATWQAWQSFEKNAINTRASGFVPTAPGNYEKPIWWRLPDAEGQI